jgi:hypothetical protein
VQQALDSPQETLKERVRRKLPIVDEAPVEIPEPEAATA